MTATRRDFTITQLEPTPAGWRAKITINGSGAMVEKRYGCWWVLCGETRRELLGPYAAALQERVRPLEKRAERRQTA